MSFHFHLVTKYLESDTDGQLYLPSGAAVPSGFNFVLRIVIIIYNTFFSVDSRFVVNLMGTGDRYHHNEIAIAMLEEKG
ncbi:hypothetical protein I8751_16245 [Nostocaceae cyanobacterium CENA357]|uniref:Uncharacterized protein n=1 Tax=Atlanticothrix silvestris CENA357 TaxID=1725252 RepID=A0A8J7L4R8_9CYAN|nr:hypothetical protein [Atlanticothrix silvestris CENA357]